MSEALLGSQQESSERQDLSNILGLISKLIGVKFKNSLRTIYDSIFSPGWTNLCNIVGEIKKSKFFSPGSDFNDQIFTEELSDVDWAVVLRQSVLKSSLSRLWQTKIRQD